MSATTRVRGLAPWSPQTGTRELLDRVRAVLIEYEAHLPLTIRQVFYRLAVIPEQIVEFGLPTVPKETDRRAFEGETTQAEALPPDALASIVREAVEQRLDAAAYDAVLAMETAARGRLSRRLRPLLRDLGDAS